MMERLLQLGINGDITRWVESFLTDQVQCVRMNRVLSSPSIINTGVPQFILYTNKCRSNISGHVTIKFANDTAMWVGYGISMKTAARLG